MHLFREKEQLLFLSNNRQSLGTFLLATGRPNNFIIYRIYNYSISRHMLVSRNTLRAARSCTNYNKYDNNYNEYYFLEIAQV